MATGWRELKGDDPEPQLQTCAPCHSRRGMLNADFRPGDKYTDHYALEFIESRHLSRRRTNQGRSLRLRFVHSEQDVPQGHPLHRLP